ncbi:membrane metallo-endopeptidase-like 1 [Ixodes scapularis]|uniref:membrane metallo-endopeptidase-like 1 n=1 Tax=Ixodes scapularis TaxID=6945 RepID=UPI001C39397D|nr:membrane metallo-endopeptidase-like 1 [Ixodes scapularis]
MLLSSAATAIFATVIFVLWYAFEVSNKNDGQDFFAGGETKTTTAGMENVPEIKPVEQAASLCTSASCQQFSSIFQLTLLNETDPCDDFYQYVCGGWKARNPNEYSVKTEHQQRIVSLMETILLQRRLSAKTIDDKALFLYDSCMTLSPNQETLRMMLREVGVDNDADSGEHPLEKMIRINALFGVSILFDIKRSTTITCAGRRILVFHLINPTMYTMALERLMKGEGFMRNVFWSVLNKTLSSETFKEIDEVNKFLLSRRIEDVSMTSTRRFRLADGGIFGGNVRLSTVFMYLGKYLKQKFEEEDCIGADSSELLTTLGSFLESFKNETLHRFLDWSVLRRAAPMADPSLVEGKYRHMYCFDNLERVLRHPTSANYLLTLVAPGDHTMRQASNLIKAVVDASLFLIGTTDWMGTAEKRAVGRKMNNIKRVMGYPRGRMDDDLGSLPPNASSMDSLQIWAHEVRAARDKQLDASRVDVGPLYPLGTKLMVRVDDNTFGVPAALLVPPFFGRGGAESVNFGILGTSVASAVLGLAFLGEQNTTKVEKGSSDLSRQLNSTMNCLNKAYREATGKTLDEADLEGGFLQWTSLTPAYMAFLSMSEGKRLKGLEFLGDEQLFYMAFCYSMCENAQAASLGERASLASPRCNVPLSMAPQFADAFRCPAGSPMRRESPGCSFWLS